MKFVISKTDYLLYRECPKNTWLKIWRQDIYYAHELSAFEKSIIETGNEVESEARKLYPTGILIEGRDLAAQEKTAGIISNRNGDLTLFQPVFVKDGFMAACDVLKFNVKDEKWSLYEIKATNQLKEKTHLFDLAFQANLLARAGLTLGTIGLIHLNPDYVRKGELDITKLFKIDDLSCAVRAILEKVNLEMEQAKSYLVNEKEPSGPCTCVYKGRSSHCTTFKYSNPHIPEYSVHDIARIGLSKNKLIELIDGNIYRPQDVPESIELSEIQSNQINTLVTDRPIIHADKIAEELEQLIFPLYFLDYETFPCAVPRFDGFSPYQQIPFQYSLHVLMEPGMEPKHLEFLHEENSDPSRALAETLEKHIGPIGTVIVWNKKFECGRNEELGQRLPQFRSFMENINDRIYDLMDIFTKQYHVHKDYYGSTSIKYVLPVLSPELSYSNLEIREGGTASQKWNEMTTGDISIIEKKKIANNLKKYCCRDTYAMYSIWRHLYRLVHADPC